MTQTLCAGRRHYGKRIRGAWQLGPRDWMPLGSCPWSEALSERQMAVEILSLSAIPQQKDKSQEAERDFVR